MCDYRYSQISERRATSIPPVIIFLSDEINRWNEVLENSIKTPPSFNMDYRTVRCQMCIFRLYDFFNEENQYFLKIRLVLQIRIHVIQKYCCEFP